MRAIFIIIMLASHVLAALPFGESIRKGKLANTADFAVLSLLLYYDLGLVLELLGYPYTSPYFSSLLDTSNGNFMLAVVFLTLAPWLFHIGSSLTNRGVPRQSQEPVSTIKRSREVPFYVLASLIPIPLVLYTLSMVLNGGALWEARFKVGSELGPFIVIMYLPLYLLAFYVRQTNSRTRWGFIFTFALAFASVLATLSLGERWPMLLPFVVIALFRFKMTLTRIALVGLGVVVVASVLLTVFKSQFAGSDSTLDGLIASTISGDIARAGVLETVLRESDSIGTHVLPYPMAGYVYTASVYAPRPLAPFKGYSTAIYFTAHETGTQPELLNWAFGLGYFEELMLNGGLLFVIPGLFIYGMAMGLIDRLSWRIPSLLIPGRLLVVWLGGYDLAPSFVIFGTMGIVGFGLHRLFVAERKKRRTVAIVQSEAESPRTSLSPDVTRRLAGRP